MDYVISGIQQMGIGVPDADAAWAWYRKYFGTDVAIFQEEAEAALMLPYTGGEPRKRYAILAINMQGGGGFEIWQYKSRTPQPPNFEVQLGDYGMFVGKVKTADVAATYAFYQEEGVELLSPMVQTPEGKPTFYLKDPYNNIFQIVHSDNWFQTPKRHLTGGSFGTTIGVSDVDASIHFYREALGYDIVVYDEIGTFEDLSGLLSGNLKVRRALLRHSEKRKGAFAPILGDSEIEFIQALEREPQDIYKDRLWGDLGFIHLCFDIRHMDKLGEKMDELGHPFTVNSGDFDMGEAAGHFTYVEDPDRTLIEFVETHKVPVAAKFGIYLNLKNRNPEKPLPRLMLKALGLNRKKD
jgi:catechol 2,3-dioxygenase-like lactoylglutathione lyase family enzyme